MSLRPQAHDIITFWLFNTLVKSQLHFGQNPWKNVMISGFVLDPYGEKMSKSKGNVIEPQLMIDKYSSDAMRFWACSAKLGEDSAFAEKELVAGQKTVTKLWNATKFVFMNLKDYKFKEPKKLEFIDSWMLSKLNQLVQQCTDSFENYDYSRTKAEVEKFFWHTLCDNYFEIVKDRIYNSARSKNEKASAQYVLYQSLMTVLKLFAPIMPYITEELWQLYFAKKEKSKSIHISKWPQQDESLVNEKINNIGDDAMDVLSRVRQEKSKAGKSLKTEIKMTMLKDEIKKLQPVMKDLQAVTNAKEIREGKVFLIELLQ
jgi:valyl-tRNA synthetase